MNNIWLFIVKHILQFRQEIFGKDYVLLDDDGFFYWYFIKIVFKHVIVIRFKVTDVSGEWKLI